MPERLVTIVGDPSENLGALDCVLDRIAEDPMSGSCLTLHYMESQGGVAVPSLNPAPASGGGGRGYEGGGGGSAARGWEQHGGQYTTSSYARER